MCESTTADLLLGYSCWKHSMDIKLKISFSGIKELNVEVKVDAEVDGDDDDDYSDPDDDGDDNIYSLSCLFPCNFNCHSTKECHVTLSE